MENPQRWLHLAVAGLAMTLLAFSISFAAVEMPAASYTKGLTWLGHASFRLVRGGVTIYFDPWQVSAAPHDADLVLITHPHFDHLSPEDVAKVARAETVIVTAEGCQAQLRQAQVPGSLRGVKPGDRLTVKGVSIEVVPSYNTNKTFHLKANQWVGYIVELDQTRIYHAGDTDLIPEMKAVRVDVALLPVSGTYVMTAEEAAQAAKVISARVTVPMHYGSIVGTVADARRFQKLCGGLIVEILPRETGK